MRDRERAERCFALARSTTFPAERDTAIARGEAIVRAAGLSIDDFDIPGRPRVARAHRPRPELFATGPRATETRFGRHAAPERYSAEDVVEVTRAFRAHMCGVDAAMRSFEETLKRRAAEAGAADEETVYEARRRNFERAVAEARARDEARGRA